MSMLYVAIIESESRSHLITLGRDGYAFFFKQESLKLKPAKYEPKAEYRIERIVVGNSKSDFNDVKSQDLIRYLRDSDPDLIIWGSPVYNEVLSNNFPYGQDQSLISFLISNPDFLAKSIVSNSQDGLAKLVAQHECDVPLIANQDLKSYLESRLNSR